MESPADYLDSPMDGDDVAYPCKGCGDVRINQRVAMGWSTDCDCRYWKRARLSNLVSESAFTRLYPRAPLVAFWISLHFYYHYLVHIDGSSEIQVQ